MTVAEITDILNAPPGTRLVYHRGYLARDRGCINGRGRSPSEDAVNDTAAIAWKLYAQGRVILVQRRIGADDYEYIAIRRAGPKPERSGALASQLRVLA